ncbi:hypothetical protein BB559_006968 [Furculomyces boomerangus]|uniref:Uncharacterized protein n=1 Tax=Furculomyces boomerangus TaxID=61424 RepID=A0A2T9XZR3_9FUNG|nr:hypothetical protein BB559_006968 [Furculomyces boomerangus]
MNENQFNKVSRISKNSLNNLNLKLEIKAGNPGTEINSSTFPAIQTPGAGYEGLWSPSLSNFEFLRSVGNSKTNRSASLYGDNNNPDIARFPHSTEKKTLSPNSGKVIRRNSVFSIISNRSGFGYGPDPNRLNKLSEKSKQIPKIIL